MKQLDFEQVRAVFLAARDLHDAARIDALRQACHGDDELRCEVESLLAHHDLQRHHVTAPVVKSDAFDFMIESASSHAEPLPRSFGAFELLEIVGRGGMGTVYKARQRTPDRVVAVKIIRPGMMTPAMLERFRYEADLLARLQHPGIAQIFEAGAVQANGAGQPFLAMEFVSGRAIDAYVREHSLSLRPRIEMLASVCDAVHHAHQKGVIHRDLKPANILVIDERDSQAEGSPSLGSRAQPKILDFGVARATDADLRATSLQTGIGQLIGTLPYMSPEQVSGDPQRLDIRSDVYALGVLIFEILTGALPYDLQRKSIAEAALIIRDARPARMSAISRTLRGDLDTIVAKALEKDSSRRYESAAALADDLRRYLAHQPIIARPPSAMYQLRLFTRRHRALVAGSALAIAGLVLAAIVSLGFALHSQRAAELEAKQRRIAERTNEHLKTMLTLPDPHQRGADMTVVQMLDEMVQRLDATPELPEVEAEVRTAVGSTYLQLRQSQQAVEQLTRAVELWRSFDPRGAQLGRTLVMLGVALLHVGDYPASETAYREASEILDPVGGRDLRSLQGGLVDMLIRREKYAEAEPIARDLLAGARLDNDPVMIVARLRRLAKICEGLRRTEQAQSVLEEALAIGQQHLPPTNPLYYNVLFDLSRLWQGRGDWATALTYSEQCYHLAQQAAPIGSNDWMASMHSHALSLNGAGRADEAILLLQKARQALASELGPDHERLRSIDAAIAAMTPGRPPDRSGS